MAGDDTVGLKAPSQIEVVYSMRFAFDSSGPTAVQVLDDGANDEKFQVILHADSGFLAASGTGVTGSGSGNLTITGKLNFVNAELATLTYYGAFFSDYDIYVNVQDLADGSSPNPNPWKIIVKVDPADDPVTETTPPSITTTAGQSFNFTGVNAVKVNDNPPNGEIFETVISATAGNLTATGAGVSDSGTGSLTVIGTVSDVNAALATLTYASTLAGSGIDTITVYTTDQADNTSVTETIHVTVNPADDAVNETVPASIATTAGHVFAFTGTNAVRVVDDALYGETFTTVISDTSGTLAASGAGVSGSGTSSLTISGTLAAVNTALATLTYASPGGSTDTITVMTTDSDQSPPISKTIHVTNAAEADVSENAPGSITPTASQSFHFAGAEAVQVVDDPANGETFQTVITDLSGSLTATGAGVTGSGTGTLTITGTVGAVDAALATLTYTRALSGTDKIAIATTDQADQSTITETIEVTTTAQTGPLRYVYTTVDYPGAVVSALTGINNNGQVVGTFQSAATHGFMETGGALATLDDPAADAVLGTEANGINDAGTVVGAYEIQKVYRGFVWNGSAYTTIVDPSAGTDGAQDEGTVASDINSSGKIVGYYKDATNVFHGFIHTGADYKTNYTTLDDPSAAKVSESGTSASGIDSSGDVVGYYKDANGIDHGFLYSNGSYKTLDDPSGQGGTRASGINNVGQIVGDYIDANKVEHGFLYTIGSNSYTTLDDPLAGGVGDTNLPNLLGTYASGINDAGVVVGNYVDTSNGTSTPHGFIASLAPTAYSISPQWPTISETAGTAIFTVTRSDTSHAATVYLSTVQDKGSSSANANYYYNDLAHQPITFAAGQASVQLPLTINNEHLASGSETFRLVAQQSATDPNDTYLASDNFTILNQTAPNHVPSDFNGDGHSDVLFSADGTVYGSDYEWQLNDRTLASQGAIDLYDKSFSVQVVGDFNGDGKADVAFENPNTGGVWEWQLDGTTIASQGAVDVGDKSYHLLGSADFNGDGKDDLLWRDDAGHLYQWQMNGRADTALYVAQVNPNWYIVGTGDFNGDGKADILFHYQDAANSADPANGAFDVLQMDGNAVTATLGVERPDASWQILGVGDFNGDGIADIAIRNVSATQDNGAVWVYLMKGTSTSHADGSVTADILAQGAVGIADPSTWHVQEIGDFNGDGKADILFRDDAGYFYSWDMGADANGHPQIASESLLQGAAQWADPSFHVVGQHWDIA